MKRVKIVGEAVVRMTYYMDVPDDEVSELTQDGETLICNMDEEEAAKEVVEWHWIRGEVMPCAS